MNRFSVEDVVRWRLCLGCGACAYMSGGRLVMKDHPKLGLCPAPAAGDARPEAEFPGGYCPGLGASAPKTPPGADPHALRLGLGPVLEVWEGHATDPEIRHRGSSGGALTALACFAVEESGMAGALHVTSDPEFPIRNRTVLSRSRQQFLAGTGSRYAPASVCERLDLVETAPGPCAVIGQPSEVAALAKLRKIKPSLDAKIGIVLSFYCAGSPATSGTENLLRARGVEPAKVLDLRYRGNGWPGNFAARIDGAGPPEVEMSYAESWAELQAHRPWSTHLWPDGGGEHADISCGDPWHRPVEPGAAGSSLIVVRTELGREFLRRAVAAGYLEITPSTAANVHRAQRNLMEKKAATWGRSAALRVLGIPTPRHSGYGTFPLWRRLGWAAKARSTAGTARRAVVRKYRKPEDIDDFYERGA